MILGPNDPRAITDERVLAAARKATERFNREVLGLAPLTPQEQADKDALLDSILKAINYQERTPNE